MTNIVISFSSRAVHRTVLQLTNRSGTNQNIANIKKKSKCSILQMDSLAL
jgi:hypothetical protein